MKIIDYDVVSDHEIIITIEDEGKRYRGLVDTEDYREED